MSDDKSYNDEGSSKSGSSAEDAETGSGGAGEMELKTPLNLAKTKLFQPL